MSRNMSWLRSAGFPLGHGTKHLLRLGLPVPAWTPPASASARVWIAKDYTTQPSSLARRPLSTQRTARNSGQSSRFRRSSASPAETPAGPATESLQTEPTVRKPGTSEPVEPTRPVPRPGRGSREIPKPRKPVDVNSKEYKDFEKKWVRLVVGLPFLIVSSWLLYKRREYFWPAGGETCY